MAIEKNKMKPDNFNLVENSIMFFNKNAYSNEFKTYFSEVDTNGNVTSDNIHLVALSRLIYALEYASKFDSKYEERAVDASKFFLSHMIVKDSIGNYFNETVSTANEALDQKSLGIWQQSYGLCGLVAIYRLTKDEKTLKIIHQVFDGYIKRFHDEQSLGFVGSYSFADGSQFNDKSLQSILYPLSAALFYLWEIDIDNRDKYEPFIKENTALLLDKSWNPDLGWVNLKFDSEWNLCGKVNNTEPCYNVSPGHNFQLSWVLLKLSNFSFLEDKTRTRCKELGNSILENTMKKSIWAKEVSNGFVSEINPANNTIISKQKTWWQHAEAITALSYAKEKYSNEFKMLLNFFTTNFVDFKNGNEHFCLNEDNSPVLDKPKGSMGKSSYHITEMIYYMNQNQ